MAEFFTGLFTAVLRFIQALVERPTTAVDSDVDRGRLRRAGDRIRGWVHKNRSGS